MWLNLLSLINKRWIGYLLILFFVAGFILQQRLKIENLERQISQIKMQLQQKENEIKICSSNRKTFLSNIEQRDKIIKQLQKELNEQKNLCNSLLQKKDKLISDLQKLKMFKPEPVKSTVIIKKQCKLKIETGEQLHEKDFIFDTLSNIGK